MSEGDVMAEIIQFPERPLITFKRTETKAYLGAVLEALMSVKEDCQYLQDRAKSEHNDNAYIRLRDVMWNVEDIQRVITYIINEQL